MPRSYARDPKTQMPGMEPDNAYRGHPAAEPGPDEPGVDEAEGHGIKIKFAKERAPDERAPRLGPTRA
jgi:hypothetical protein